MKKLTKKDYAIFADPPKPRGGPLVKLTYLPFDRETQVVMIDEFEGIIEDHRIRFTTNIAPEEPDDKATHGSIRKDLVNHIKYLEKVIYLMNLLGPKTKVEWAFYWGEGDLNLEFCISTQHPLVKHLFPKKTKREFVKQ